MRMPVKEAHLRPGGTVSGLNVCVGRLWDVCGHPFASGERGLAVTTNCSIDFMRKPEAGRDFTQFAVSTNWAACWLLGMR